MSTTRRLPASVALYLQASIVLFFLAGSSAPTPLYSIYQGEWGFSAITTTIVFGVYALAVLAALLTVGSLSDHIGRRPVLLVALGMQIATMVIFLNAGGVEALLIARVVQGLSTGFAVGAIGAGMLDIDRSRGTILNAVAPMSGTALGGLLAGVLVQYLPQPVHLIYLVLLAIFVVQALGVVLMAETSAPKSGALASLRPAFGVPAAARRPFFIAAPALVAVWALAGFYGSLGPSLVRVITGSSSHVLGGLALFVLAASGAVATVVLRQAQPGRVMLLGVLFLLGGVGLTLLAITDTSTTLFFVGTAVAGVGFGGGFQGAIRTTVPLAAPHERSGLLSSLFAVSYLSMGLPAVIAGFLVVHEGGLMTTAKEYAAFVLALAALALIGLLRPVRMTEPVSAPSIPALIDA